MGRFDALTQLDTKLLPNTPLTEKAEPIPAAPPPKDQLASKPTNTQTDLHASMQMQKSENMQTRLHANQQTSKDASMQAGKHASMQTSKQVNMQTGKQVNLQTGKQVIIEKYSSYLTYEYKRELKRIAFESDRSEYEVLIEAVEQFLARHKQSK